MDTVAPGFGADINHRVALARCGGIKNLVLARHAHAHGIDQNVAIVAGVEIGLAAHRGYPETVAIAANAGHHAAHQMAGFWVVGAAKAQGV